MNKKISVAVLSASTILFSACGGSGKAPVATVPPAPTTTAPTELKVTTVSGVQTSLDGSYATGCHDNGGGNSIEELLSIASDVWTYTAKKYTATTTCAGTPATTQAVVATLAVSAGGDKAIVGWVEGGGGAVAAPTAADASGPLSDTESYTPLTIVVTSSEDPDIAVGFTNTNLYYIVDDKGAKLRLYRDSDATHAGNFDFWEQQ